MPDNQKKDKRIVSAPMLGAALATPGAMALTNSYRKKHQVNYTPQTNRLLLLAEGGPHSKGGTGHESTAKAVAAAHEEKFGSGTAKVLFTNEYNLVSNSHNMTEERYQILSDEATPPLKRLRAQVSMPVVYGTSHLTDLDKLHKEVSSFAPDRVISTHPKSSDVVRKIGIAPEQILTDYGADTPLMKDFWKRKSVAKHYAPIDNFDDNAVKITSLPVHPKFLQDSNTPRTNSFIRRDNDKNELGVVNLDPNKKRILAISGSTGAQLDDVVANALKSKADFQLVAVTGKNRDLFNKLNQINDPRLIVQGYETALDKLIGESDLGLVRPHGLSATEVAGRGLPFIPVVTNSELDSWGPHMVGNANWYSKKSSIPVAALDINNDLSSKLDDVLLNFDKYKDSSKNLTNLVRENAAKQVVDAANQTNLKAGFSPAFKASTMAAAGLGLGALAFYPSLQQKASKSEPIQKVVSSGAAGPIPMKDNTEKRRRRKLFAALGATTGLGASIYGSKKLIVDPLLRGTSKLQIPGSVAAIIGATTAGTLGGSYMGTQLEKVSEDRKDLLFPAATTLAGAGTLYTAAKSEYNLLPNSVKTPEEVTDFMYNYIKGSERSLKNPYGKAYKVLATHVHPYTLDNPGREVAYQKAHIPAFETGDVRTLMHWADEGTSIDPTKLAPLRQKLFDLVKTRGVLPADDIKPLVRELTSNPELTPLVNSMVEPKVPVAGMFKKLMKVQGAVGAGLLGYGGYKLYKASE